MIADRLVHGNKDIPRPWSLGWEQREALKNEMLLPAPASCLHQRGLDRGSSQSDRWERGWKLGNCYLQPCFFGELVLPCDLFSHFEIFHSFIPQFIHGISSTCHYEKLGQLHNFFPFSTEKSSPTQSHVVCFSFSKVVPYLK